VDNALKFLGFKAIVTSDPALIKHADLAILPGVGAFADGMMDFGKKGLIEPNYDS